MNDPVVLVVDDEKSLRDFVRRNLEARHYKVLTAANGLEAMATFNNEKVDLVILDLMMKSGFVIKKLGVGIFMCVLFS